MPDDPARPRDPRLLRAGLVVVAAQAVALAAAAVWLGVHAASGARVSSAGVLALDIVSAALAAAALGLLARALARGSGAARTPTFLIEALCLPVGVGLFQGHRPGYGVAVLGSALAAITLLARGLSPRAR